MVREVPVQEDEDFRRRGLQGRDTRQTGASVASAALTHDPDRKPARDESRVIGRAVVHDDDLRDQMPGNVAHHERQGVALVEDRDDDGHLHGGGSGRRGNGATETAGPARMNAPATSVRVVRTSPRNTTASAEEMTGCRKT